MNKITIAFDVDQTLITPDFKPIYKNIDLLIKLSEVGDILVWSGGGKDYAEQWVRKLGLEQYVEFTDIKNTHCASYYNVQISFDDQEVKLGLINFQLPY